MNIGFGPQLCSDLAAGSEREWLVTDGLGGYAMGTVSGLRTRRYHGLLVVATDPPRARRMGLVSVDPIVVVGTKRIRLATHEWRSGVVEPDGYLHRTGFRLVDGLPRWRWSLGPVVLEVELAMCHGRSALGLVHRCLAADAPVTIEFEVLCTWRDIHGETSSGQDPSVDHADDGFVFAGAYRVTGPQWSPGGVWYRDVHHRMEAERGLRADEDLWCAGRFRSVLSPGDEACITAWALSGPQALGHAPPPATQIVADAHRRARSLVATARHGTTGAADGVADALVLAADQFVVAPDTVVAGYPWFSDWSRDTLIAYRGLFLETGRAAEGRRVLQRLAGTIAHGLLANTSDSGHREDNSADAPLWFIQAVAAHVEATGDEDLAAELCGPMLAIVDAYRSGTRFGIGVDEAGLVRVGQPGMALTWMDARVDGVPVTERAGCPVEINALWISGLGVLARLHRRLGRDDAVLRSWADHARRSFSAFRVASGQRGGLVDVLASDPGGRPDASLRPNQLLAVSLPDAPLGPDAVASVLDACGPLVTTLGMRTLAPDDPSYRGCHHGDGVARDSAYHQGTVWPWLIGPFADALARAGPDVRSMREPIVRAVLQALSDHLGDWGLGSVSETFDGDAPHRATGCPFQAWSVAELLRARRLSGLDGPTVRRWGTA